MLSFMAFNLSTAHRQGSGIEGSITQASTVIGVLDGGLHAAVERATSGTMRGTASQDPVKVIRAFSHVK
jgi:hypothetical protein